MGRNFWQHEAHGGRASIGSSITAGPVILKPANHKGHLARRGHCPSLAPSCFCGKSGAENGHVRQAPIPTRHTHTHAHVCTHAHACARAHTHNSDARISSKPGKAGASGPGENAVRGVGRSRRGFAGHEGVKCRSVCRLALRRQRGPEWLCPGTPTPESQLLRAPGRVPLSSWTGGQPRSQGKQCPWLLSPPPQAGSLPPRPTPPRRPPPGPSPPHGEARHSHSLHASCEMSLFSPPVCGLCAGVWEGLGSFCFSAFSFPSGLFSLPPRTLGSPFHGCPGPRPPARPSRAGKRTAESNQLTPQCQRPLRRERKAHPPHPHGRRPASAVSRTRSGGLAPAGPARPLPPPGRCLPPLSLSCPSTQPARPDPQPAPDPPALPAGPALPLGGSGIHPTGVQAHGGGASSIRAPPPRPPAAPAPWNKVHSDPVRRRPAASAGPSAFLLRARGAPTPRGQRAAGAAPAPAPGQREVAPGRRALWSS